MTLSAADVQVYAIVSLCGAVYCMGKALDVVVDAVIAAASALHADVMHQTYVREGNRTVVVLFYKNGNGVERTTDFIGSCSTVRERTFVWRFDDRGVPQEWVRQ